MIVISDTSVISNLAQVHQIDLLRELYSRIVIPQKVKEELNNDPSTLELIKDIDWIDIGKISNQDLYNNLIIDLDPGEAEAIVLAKELGAGLLMIDERKGRKIAKENGIPIVGVLGLLTEAKKEGLIDKVKPILDKLIFEIGFRVNPKLYRYVLSTVDEI